MIFDGTTNAPMLLVSVALNPSSGLPQGSITDPNAAFFVLDRDHLDTGQLGSLAWTDFSADVTQVSFSLGQGSELDDPQPQAASIVLDNYSGNYDPLNGSSPYNGLLDVGTPIWVRAIWAGVTYNLWRGFIDSIQTDVGRQPQVTYNCLDALEVLGRTSFTSAYADGDATGARIGHILDNALWPSSQRSIDTGYSLCQATNDPATSALNQIADTVATELGLLASDGTGNIIFYDRLHPYLNSRSTTVQATFSDTGANVDVLAVNTSRDRQLLFNQTRITRNGGTEQVYNGTGTAVLGGQTSQQQYGVRTYQGRAGTLLRTDTDAFSLGGFIVARFQYPTSRLTQIQVDGAQTGGQWPALLGLTFLDRVRVIRNYGPNTIDRQGAIVGMAHAITQDAWQVTFNTRNLDDFSPFILDNATYGQLASVPFAGFGHLA